MNPVAERANRWPGRAATAEAIVWLATARMLVAWVPFGRWRGWLGSPVAPETIEPDLHLAAHLAHRRLARAVERAAEHLAGDTLCLPQAMALQWMLRRRNLGGVLHIGVRPGDRRGHLDDLHAWVTRSGEMLIGHIDEPHSPLFAVANPQPGVNRGTHVIRGR